eukprot:2453911-Pyramimonas_sp.AAC.1
MMRKSPKHDAKISPGFCIRFFSGARWRLGNLTWISPQLPPQGAGRLGSALGGPHLNFTRGG